MKKTLVVTVLVSVCVAAWGAIAIAQDGPALMRVSDRHFKPGMFAQLEEVMKRVAAFQGEHDFPFAARRFTSDRGVLRTINPLAGWADMDKRGMWFQQLSSPPDFGRDIQRAGRGSTRSTTRRCESRWCG